MELSDVQLVEVKTLDENKPTLQVLMTVRDGCISAAELHRKVCDSLNISDGSREVFSLFMRKENIKVKIKLNQALKLPLHDVMIEKWCFDEKTERKVLSSDSNATHLIFVQAYKAVKAGRLNPSKEQLEQLEGCLDPNFLTEKQYIQICQSVKNYFSFRLDDCVLTYTLEISEQQITRGSAISVYLCKEGLTFLSDTCISAPWDKLKSWVLSLDEEKVTFTLDISNTVTNITMETQQGSLLVSAVMEFIKLLLKYNPSLPSFHSSMVKSLPDGSTLWENSTYGVSH